MAGAKEETKHFTFSFTIKNWKISGDSVILFTVNALFEIAAPSAAVTSRTFCCSNTVNFLV